MENITKAQIVQRLLENKSITASEAVTLLQEQTQYIPVHPINIPQVPINIPQVPNYPLITPYFKDYNNDEEMVPYGTYCSCNPANGGSGICGCVMANKLVPKRKYGYYITTTTTTDNIKLNLNGDNENSCCGQNCGCK